MIEQSIWREYNDTIEFLTAVNKDTNGKIACKPEFKIVEDEMIVGVLTQTNQFVQLSKPFSLMNVRDNIPILQNNNFIVDKNTKPMISIDVPIMTSNNVDNERVEYIKKIKLETNFYNVFRNTIRILLNDYENLKLRESVEEEINKSYVIYSKKLESIHKYLKILTKNIIIFTENYDFNAITEISTCLVNKDKTKCESKSPLCAFTTESKCQIILPKINLITQLDNELFYFGKMADELIRYSRIKSFILEPQIYLSFSNLNYNLNEDEIIMIQSMLTQEYFDGLIPTVLNKYVKYNTYDEVEPIKHGVYENSYSMEQALNPKNIDECISNINDKILSLTWRNCFPTNFKEKEYSKTKYCTFYLIIDLIKEKTGKVFDINGIRNELYKEYTKYLPKFEGQLLDIIISQGKKILGSHVKAKKITFENLIFTENYYLTTIDYYLLTNIFEIPTFFISAKYLFETNFTKHEFLAYGERDNTFCFIIVPGLRQEEIPNFKIIQSPNNTYFFNLTEIKNNEPLIFALTNKKSLQNYIETFSKSSKYIYQKKKPKNTLLIEDDEEEENMIHTQSRLVEPIKICPEGKIINPKTNRCIKVKENIIKPILKIIDEYDDEFERKKSNVEPLEEKSEESIVITKKPKKKRTMKEKKVIDKRKTKKNTNIKPILEVVDSM
jgi:hypothetical protein